MTNQPATTYTISGAELESLGMALEGVVLNDTDRATLTVVFALAGAAGRDCDDEVSGFALAAPPLPGLAGLDPIRAFSLVRGAALGRTDHFGVALPQGFVEEVQEEV